MVEKLWQSTMQRKGLQLSSRPRRGGTIGATDSRIEEDLERHRNTGEEGLEQGTPSDNEDKQEEPEDGWPTLDDMSSMDSQTKLRWMMKMMVLPPCWKERKVRLFGAFGVLEENVLR
ncbi:hypothetical protein BGX28_004007 [Mortierella sp. GBA30]|nr:hypothetical protein BGX28_004007 [Mortierella sp. GBA30]